MRCVLERCFANYPAQNTRKKQKKPFFQGFQGSMPTQLGVALRGHNCHNTQQLGRVFGRVFGWGRLVSLINQGCSRGSKEGHVISQWKSADHISSTLSPSKQLRLTASLILAFFSSSSITRRFGLPNSEIPTSESEVSTEEFLLGKSDTPHYPRVGIQRWLPPL